MVLGSGRILISYNELGDSVVRFGVVPSASACEIRQDLECVPGGHN